MVDCDVDGDDADTDGDVGDVVGRVVVDAAVAVVVDCATGVGEEVVVSWQSIAVGVEERRPTRTHPQKLT